MSASNSSRPAGSLVESRAIEFIPRHERHGSVFSQFTLWLGVNLNVTAVVIGALAVVSQGSALWAIVGLFVGLLIGGAILSLHAIQGPKLGLPQMISTRAQFGVKGAALPLALVCLMCIGLSASGTVLAGQSLSALLGITTLQGILLFAVLTVVLTVMGYRTIHHMAKVASLLGIFAFVYMFISLFAKQDVTTVLRGNGFHFSSFLLAVSLSASWLLSFGPFVADYSRYLPHDTSKKWVFLATMSGAVIGALASMTFGVFAASLAGDQFSGHEMNYIVGLSSAGAIAVLLYLAISIGKITAIAMNSYTSAISFMTLFDRENGTRSKTRQRIVFSVLSVLAAMLIALWGQHSFLSSFSSFVLLMLTFLTPWSAINLIEFYSDRDSYAFQTEQLVKHDGIYKGVNWPMVVLYLASIAIQVPFIATGIYTGPLVAYFDGADISWLIGLAFPTIILLGARLVGSSTPSIQQGQTTAGKL